jgi:hypothetical protein
MVFLDVVEPVVRVASPDHLPAAIALRRDNGPESTALFTTDEPLMRVCLLDAA